MLGTIDKVIFGTLKDGRSVDLYSLTNENGMLAKITPFGGTLVALLVPNRAGKLEDVVLGYDDLESYIEDSHNFGTTVGRYGNRIGKGQLEIEGKKYQLAINNGPNHLHGGQVGFAKKLWNAKLIEIKNGVGLELNYISEDGEENYPGTLDVKVTYQLTNKNELLIDYAATTDKTTVVNLTHHSYFNLNGNDKGDILDHELMINSDGITKTDEELIPTGEIAKVANTPFDFRKATTIGTRINDENEQLKFGNGYDHNWALNNRDKSLRLAATLYAPQSGRLMETWTTEPGLQIYTGNWLSEEVIGKNGKPYKSRKAICLETQHFPDSPNKPNFPSTLLTPEEKYSTQTMYRFAIR